MGAVGGPRGGKWTVLVQREAEYDIALRRWPRETGLALGEKSGPMSKAFAVSGAKVAVAGKEAGVKVKPADREAVLRLRLPAGKTTMQAWFQDADGKDVCGAFYAYVRRAK